ncbi:methyl-accepting chemotaxis protein [Niallia sp.]|uniref:methyl-accepting chemotaxis protein n=1 Tax=Niallia sp. TaxID=2837523 RepID=UPI002899A9BC|nr:methyl-accepting chemotaxis protein [Niallia sp.]
MSLATKKKQSSIFKKNLQGYLIPLIISSLIFTGVTLIFTRGIVENQVIKGFEQTLEANLQVAVNEVEQEYIEEAEKGNQEAYQNLLTQLNDLKAQTNVENVYVLGKAGDDGHIIALSETDENGSEYPFTDEMNRALAGEKLFSDIYEDEFGVHKSIFVHVEGTQAILGIDMDASFINELYTQIIYVFVGLILIVLIIGSLIAYWMSKRISKPIVALANYVEPLANGDFTGETLKVTSNDEIGALTINVNKMVSQLKDLIGQVSINSEQVAATSQQLYSSAEQTSSSISMINDSIQEIASGTNEQTNEIEEISDAVEKIAHNLEDMTGKIKEVTNAATGTAKISEEGSNVVGKAVKQMQIIHENVTESADVIKYLHESSTQINEIVSLITNIAGQTNLLALNASIEAARAGDHGKGFSVVAEEVRKLAEESASAANQISEKIVFIQDQSIKAVETMSKGYEAVQTGITTVDEAGSSFENIRKSVHTVADQISVMEAKIIEMNDSGSKIAASLDNLSESSSEFSGHAQNVSAASEEQTAVMEEMVTATNTLSEMAESLQTIVNKFKL